MESINKSGKLTSDEVPLVAFRSNWKLKEKIGRDYTVHGQGADIWPIANSIIETLESQAKRDEDSLVCLNAAFDSHSDKSVSPMLLTEESPGHQIASTVTIKRKGEELFFNLNVEGYTKMRTLHWMLRSFLVAFAFLFIYGAFFKFTDQRHALFQEYGRKYKPSDPSLYVSLIETGFNPETGEKLPQPWTIWDVLKRDPKLFLTHLGGPPTLVLGGIAFLSSLIPATFFDFISRFMNWPTSSEFNHMMKSELFSLDSTVNRVLETEFGVTKSNISQF